MPTPKRNKTPSNLWQSIRPHQSLRQFENEIIQFHYQHRSPIRYLPHVLGRKIDLRQLYTSVIKRGGYKKVNEKESWEEVLSELNLPKEGTNCELAIQTIYQRFLEDYERNRWTCLGNDTDINISRYSNFISELGFRDKSVLASFVQENTPKTYCDYQQLVANCTRADLGLSCDLKEDCDLRQLTMALKSGLCNEIDFALNTLLIMSSATNHHHHRMSLLDLRFTGDLLDLVVASAGIVDTRPGSYFEQFKDCRWMKDGLKFWHQTVEDGPGRVFLVPNILSCSESDLRQVERECALPGPITDEGDRPHRLTDPGCQRAHLVCTILHNLVLAEVGGSRTAVVCHEPCLRLLLLAGHSADPVLRRVSVQTLARLRLVLRPHQDDPSKQHWFSDFLMHFLASLLDSENRSDRIAACEMVQSLCLPEENREALSKHLDPRLLACLLAQLLVPDIHPLCGALEALLSLSRLGDAICRRMAASAALLRCLLQFVTLEAQMLGPAAVHKIKTFNSRPPSHPMAAASSYVPPPNNPIPQLVRLTPGPTTIVRAPLASVPILQTTVPAALTTTSSSLSSRHELTPLQQIDHLLTKSIASFSSPSNVVPSNGPCALSVVTNGADRPPPPPATSQDDKAIDARGPRRVVQIKCCVDDDEDHDDDDNDVDITEIDKTANGGQCGPVNGDRHLNGSPGQPEGDQDRMQMPPPSLPTPSMLKRQMRISNGGLGRPAVPVASDRPGAVRAWLRRSFTASEDPRAAVDKRMLLEELCEALGGDGQDEVVPASELHAAVKEVFGPTVQVKVEHGANGDSRLIYCHLGRLLEDGHLPNGDMNGFVKHNGPQEDQEDDEEEDEDALSKKRKIHSDNGDLQEDQDQVEKAHSPKAAVVKARPLARKRKRPSAWSLSKVRRRMRSIPGQRPRPPPITIPEERPLEAATVEESPSEGAVACRWALCSQRLADEAALHKHLRQTHLTAATRVCCQWAHCQTAHIPRAPLSLLAHLATDHCQPPPACGPPQETGFLLPQQQHRHPGLLIQGQPQAQAHIQVPPPAPEKSGWSVLLDHYRSEQQQQQSLPEGPITKHIRISSSAILRNLGRHSVEARDFLRRHERQLVAVALAGQDCSPVVAQCLEEARAAPSP